MRWKCACSYDGTDFNGWQSQPNGNTIQDTIERRLFFLFRRPIRIHGSGRTDSGVHANCQVFHFDAEWKHGDDALVKSINCGIPKSIRILSAEEAYNNFHARFSAIGKQYEYFIINGNANPFNYKYAWSISKRTLNIDLMNQTAKRFIGRHDFKNFGAKHDENANENTVKLLNEAYFTQTDENIRFVTSGSGYLYKMVRIILGCLVQVGLGNKSADFVLDGLSPSCDHANEIRKECAPPCGLFLKNVFY